jgi:hypothetical protein
MNYLDSYYSDGLGNIVKIEINNIKIQILTNMYNYKGQ